MRLISSYKVARIVECVWNLVEGEIFISEICEETPLARNFLWFYHPTFEY